MFQVGHARATTRHLPPRPPADTSRASPRVASGLQQVRNAGAGAAARREPLPRKQRAETARAADEALAQLYRDDQGRYTGNRRYMEFAILKCAQAGRREQAQALFDEMQAIGRRNKGMEPDAKTWNFLMSAYCVGKNANPARVHALLRAMQDANVQPDRCTWNRVVQAHADPGDVPGARSAMQAMRRAGFEPDTICYTQVLNACAQQADVGQALELFREVRASNVRCDVKIWNQVIKAHASAADAVGAVAMFERMQAPGSGVSPNIFTYNEVIRAHLMADDTPAALAVLDDMHAGRAAVPPDVATYTQVIDALTRADQAKRGLALFRRMQSVGIEPDLLACNVVLHACAVASDAETAMRLLRRMQAPGSNVRPNACTWSTVMDACAYAGRTGDVLALLAEMQAPDAPVQPDEITFNTAIKACAMDGDTANAMRLFRDMQDRGIEPGVETYLPLISVQAHGGTTAEAERLFGCVEALVDATRHFDIVNRVLIAHVGDGASDGVGDPASGERWLRSVWHRDPTTRLGFPLWRDLIAAFDKAGRPADVQRLLREAVEAGALHANAGFQAGALDFHLHAVAGGHALGVEGAKCVPAAWVPALMAYHREIGNVTDTTSYVVGYRRGDRIKDAVLEVLRKQGLDYVEDPTNPGRLVPAPRRSVAIDANAASSPTGPVDWWDVRD